MTSDEGYELRDDGSESEEEFDEDSFDTKMAVLRDIMDGYDWSFLLDVRDPLFTSRMREALGFLGLGMDLRAGPPVEEGRFFRSDAELIVCLGDGLRRAGGGEVGVRGRRAGQAPGSPGRGTEGLLPPVKPRGLRPRFNVLVL